MTPLKPGDALIITDIQNDFLPGGALAISGSADILSILLAYVKQFQSRRLPLFFTRDWHPENHCSFHQRGGPWPVHCVAGSPGSLPPPAFETPAVAVIIYKAIDTDEEAYSAFHHTALDRHLRAAGVRRLFIGGLATDYCVLNTVKDARALGYDICLLMDGIMAVNVHPDDGRKAESEMIELGAVPMRLEALTP